MESSLAPVLVHRSQFPDRVARELLECLRSRQVNHKFHYDSIKQAQKWLELHEAYSPARNDPNCTVVYDRCFDAVAAGLRGRRVHLIGLGCGGGQKDARLLERLQAAGRPACYTPVDVSTPLVLQARQTALRLVRVTSCLVCDLGTTEDLSRVLVHLGPVPGGRATRPMRLLTFFGMLPNFEPGAILPKIATWLRPGDQLLLSANLAPGANYLAGVRRVLPLYDNGLTRDWLMLFLQDLGVEPGDGEIRFTLEAGAPGLHLKRITAHFHFGRGRQLAVGEEQFGFRRGDNIRLFFSYRHTPALVRELLAPYGLQVLKEWVTHSGEEGVFLVVPRS